ncbi:MAG: MBL fold metallo-hydrolase [Oscillospiraceae bacterium]|nr:MBL fold metallo-hydrolase [Oscillospiraceae bacterium]
MMEVKTIPVGNLGTNCYIVFSGKNAVVIDPGDDAKVILKETEALGVQVSYIFLTHGHFDHILAVNELTNATNAKVAAGALEYERLSSAYLSGLSLMGVGEFDPITADMEISDGGFLDVGDMHFEFLHTPGHTEGSFCIFCDDVMFSGDTLFAGTCGRCDLPGGDISGMFASLKKLYLLPGDFKVYPGHGESTLLSEERIFNPYMAEAMRR